MGELLAIGPERNQATRTGKHATSAMRTLLNHSERRMVCEKCAKSNSLEIHHIVAFQDGGVATDPDNLAYLCHECHREWHRVERCLGFSFDEWLCVPSAMDMVTAIGAWLQNESMVDDQTAETFSRFRSLMMRIALGRTCGKREEEQQRLLFGGDGYRDAAHAQAQLAGIADAECLAGGGVGQQRGDAGMGRSVTTGRSSDGRDLHQGTPQLLLGAAAGLQATQNPVHILAAQASPRGECVNPQASAVNDVAQLGGECYASSVARNITLV